tara:strand:- start:174 stop:458 length:285 start_codon:yes stop_codon:yes gene_type:complete
MLNKEYKMHTENFKVGDSVIFSGAENLLAFDEQSENLIDVFFGLSETVGLILGVKEDDEAGGEAEIYCDGQLLYLPWTPGCRPVLNVLRGNRIC